MDYQHYMGRAIELARQAVGFVWTNPMVGAVLVHNNIIIGEGFHAKYGENHAEINCIKNVPQRWKHLIPQSTMYVTLEPCSHFGKTPPCATRIVKEGIRHVVIGCTDPSDKVSGKGIAILEQAGVFVEKGILEKECKNLSRHFFHFHEQKRPFITLKWAETADGYIGFTGKGNTTISSELTLRFSHQLRASHMGIMVGYRTALLDNPKLSLRYAAGLTPVRIVVDPALSLPANLHLFIDGGRTIVLHDNAVQTNRYHENENLQLIATPGNGKDIPAMIDALYDAGIQSILVEGGAALLQQFILHGLFDDVINIKALNNLLADGVVAPHLLGATLLRQFKIDNDLISVYERSK